MENINASDLAAAFAEWTSGAVYVCKKSGRYRYRRGENRIKPTPWDETVRARFASAAEFDQAARGGVTAPEPAPEVEAIVAIVPAKRRGRKANAKPARPSKARGRVDAIALASKTRKGNRKGGRK